MSPSVGEHEVCERSQRKFKLLDLIDEANNTLAKDLDESSGNKTYEYREGSSENKAREVHLWASIKTLRGPQMTTMERC
ncbi:unnamed protein product [Eruca vesicaria subsp. sativa]|uniref:Uncharacterized protein n=1 Tax=Eruca vesicaria subsp. sativa TaxID=29727 RepID=A0ABC8LTM4_ERUVS|nr:unnamed protein product [Eruca vesicaria subsp. sativa]